ncbi:MAG TPA: VOC family protein [Acidimicrobiales bacterium]|nr:VOC family protein [Acidimicrobiales bacterium]
MVNDEPPPPLQGIHHVRVPVSDITVSRNWYSEVLGFEPVLDYEEEDRVVGVALAGDGGVTVGLQLDPARARALAGFCILALQVPGQTALGTWVEHLDAAGVAHSGVREGHLGLLVELTDPDGVVVQLHTAEHPSADEA